MQNAITFSTKEGEEEPVIHTYPHEMSEAQEENGKFWFEMYQRVKSEIAKERKAVEETQAKT
jgi:hypothetical protein